ncbi:sodium/hydrogen exchanger 10-like, partial [Asbolus verrucosus]
KVSFSSSNLEQTNNSAKLYNCPLPFSVVTIFFGVICGVISLYSTWMAQLTSIAIKLVHQEATVYLPALLFGTALCIDVHAFIKSLPQILIISIPVSFCAAFFSGSLMKLVIDPQWSIIDGIIFGNMFSAIYAVDILRWLAESGSQTKHIKVLLEGETLISTILSMYTYIILHCVIKGWIVYWYQVVMAFVRIIFFGLPAGYCYGLLGCYLQRLSYNDGFNLAVITVVLCFSSYWIFTVLSNTGTFACLMTGLMLGVERTSLPSEVEKFITDLWKVISLILNATVFLITGILAPQILSNNISFKEYFLVLVTYLLTFMGRFLSFLLFSPILSRVGYGMSFQNMIILIWGGVKNPICLSLATLLKITYSPDKVSIYFLHSVCVYILTLLINATFFRFLLKILGLLELSMSRQVNMNNCVKYMLQARERTIAILKMDRFLSDANWPLVTRATALKHPYKKNANADSEDESEKEDEDYFVGYRFTVCPDCKKNILNEPSRKELREMIKLDVSLILDLNVLIFRLNREAKMRTLKLRKIFYSRRFEHGLLTAEGIRIALQSVEVAMDSDERQIEIDELIKMFNKEVVCTIRGMRFVVIYHLCTQPPIPSTAYYVLFGCNCAIFLSDFVEFWIRILAYSRIYVCRHGFHRYFRILLHVLDFIVTCAIFLDLVLNLFAMVYTTFERSGYFKQTWYVIEGIRLTQVLSFFQLFGLCESVYPNIIRYLDAKIDRYRIIAYELAKNFISGEEEVLENLKTIVDNNRIRDILQSRIDADRLSVTKIYGICQKDRPWVAITLKTRLVIEAVLNSMKEDIQELKASGWIDDAEYLKLSKSLLERSRNASLIKSIQPLTPRMIFNEVSWMGDDDEVINFLFENITNKKFDPGDTMCSEGDIAEGIYIVIAGLFLLNYTARKDVLDKLNDTGILPIVDYLSSTKFEECSQEYIIPGNTIGELAILTERPYNCFITAETYCQIFILPRDIVKKAMEMDPDPINGLQCRLWKSNCFRIAMPILMNVTAYRSLTVKNIAFAIERSFVPDISNMKMFVVSEMMEDVLLIEGVVVDANTRDMYIGPCYIPRSVQKLLLPKSSALNIDVEVETKLLIIPAKDFDEYDIMVNEEQISEMVRDSSSKCLKHYVQDQIAKGKVSKHYRKLRSSQMSRKATSEVPTAAVASGDKSQ